MVSRAKSSQSTTLAWISQTRLAAVFLLASCSPEPVPSPGTTKVASEAPGSSEASVLVPVAKGWAQTSVNVTIFRKNALVTHGDTQYIAFYSNDASVILARRRLGTTDWETHETQYKGNVRDAHNAISIAVDGNGLLHIAWNHHNDPLQYSQGLRPDALKLTEKLPMTGDKEVSVTYPEFHTLPDGNLIFLYRDGSSGNGNLMINRYDAAAGSWHRVQDGLLDGQGQRNAYWQTAIDSRGRIHISWVWRETSDVATNHDLGYARSDDGGVTWKKSSGESYTLPITADNADYAARIPQQHELINQTTMTTDAQGHPYIASYWRPEETTTPQYHLVRHDGAAWHVEQITRRTTPFSLSGSGSRRIPISRPQLLIASSASATQAFLVFRDAERGERVSVGRCDDLRACTWRFADLTDESVGAWEPTYDPVLWQRDNVLHLLHQRVEQPDGNDRGEHAGSPRPQWISVLEWTP
jgi:hypothetical protein